MAESKGSTASVRLERLTARLHLAGQAIEHRPFLRWGLFLAGVVVLTLPGYFVQDAFALAHFADATTASWNNMDMWIRSTECMRLTGAWLAVCLPDGKLMPFAHMSGADDPGHAFLLSLAAVALDRPIAVVDVVRLNLAIDYVGLLAMATLLFTARCYVATFVILFTGVEVYLYKMGVSPHPALIGTAALAAILPLALVLSERGLLRAAARWTAFVAGAAFLGLATLIREPIGAMGMLISLGALVWLVWRHPPSRRPLRLLALLALVLVAWQTPRWVMLARDVVFDVPPTIQLQTHGIAHNLYLGLGAVDNSFGMTWDDSEGLKAARALDPKVVYLSQQYFRLIWQAYFNRLAQDPAEVAGIYRTKAGMMLDHRLPDGWWPQWIVLALVIVLLGVGTRRGLFASARFPQGPIFLCVGLAFVGFFLVQGILAEQGIGYARPIGAFVSLFFAIAAELAGRLLVPALGRKILRR